MRNEDNTIKLKKLIQKPDARLEALIKAKQAEQ